MVIQALKRLFDRCGCSSANRLGESGTDVSEKRRCLLFVLPFGVLILQCCYMVSRFLVEPTTRAASVRLPLPGPGPTPVILQQEGVIVFIEGDVVTAFSDVCPHLGCRLSWQEDIGAISCPCHGSVFSREGRKLKGPSDRDMIVLASRREGGDIIVDMI